MPLCNDGKPRTGVLDVPADRARLVTFNVAYATFKRGGFDGLAIALGPLGDGRYLQGIDLDHVEANGLVDLIPQLSGYYMERSISGDGLHAIGIGRSFTLRSSGGIEAWSEGRALVMTGDAPPGSELVEPSCFADFVEQVLVPHQLDSPADTTPRGKDDLRERVRDALLVIRADDHTLWVKICMALKKTLGEDGYPLFEAWSRKSPKFNAEEAERVWRTAKPTRTGVKAIFNEAMRWGWVDPEDGPRADPAVLENFVADRAKGTFVLLPTLAEWKAGGVDSMFGRVPRPSGGKPMLASEHLKQYRGIDQFVWDPARPEEVKGQLMVEGVWIHSPGFTCRNVYRPPTIVPKAGDASPWVKHIETLWPEEADHLLDFFAHLVQRPGVKINHAPVLIGPQGIGKDTAVEGVRPALGPWNFREISPREIGGNFNDHMKSTLLRISEGRDLGELGSIAFGEAMKTIIATPPDVVRYNVKYAPIINIRNVCGVVITSNHEDALHLTQIGRAHV